jgi:hypothetical protein
MRASALDGLQRIQGQPMTEAVSRVLPLYGIVQIGTWENSVLSTGIHDFVPGFVEALDLIPGGLEAACAPRKPGTNS